MISARDFLVRGPLAGLFAGLVAFGVAYVIGEPSVNAAIAIEESAGSGHDQGRGAGVERGLPWHQSAAPSPRWAC